MVGSFRQVKRGEELVRFRFRFRPIRRAAVATPRERERNQVHRQKVGIGKRATRKVTRSVSAEASAPATTQRNKPANERKLELGDSRHGAPYAPLAPYAP